MWDFLLNQIPWWVQALILGVVVGVPLYLAACAIFGVKVASRYLIHGLLALATLGLASKLRQDGYRARVDQEEKALDKAEAIVDEKRSDIQGLPDDRLDERIDKWVR